ncbi:hypothetical protein D7030_04605 [Flavobacteriaceae bacterium AU392]|nr:hypothetical protein D1817_11080 [Flavobacteriaceae bacterium]RKM85957.1 hypothetical protein D7030_04605 [Flavobacteriaceae bacterium AU392]
MNRLLTYFERPILRHLLFWLVVYGYFVLSVNDTNVFFADYKHILKFYGLLVFTQIIIAYTCIYVLLPRFLNRKKTILFIFWMFISLYMVYTFDQSIRVFYFDVEYYSFYDEKHRGLAVVPFWDRLTHFSAFLSKSILYLTPTALLLMIRFYKNQQKFSKLNEQKKIAELTALKHQLNPHFLFNTLNNLYALTLDKSDKAPEVIERLSGILDYILYKCKENYVSIQKEIELIENYLSLEKVRYGNRIKVNFTYSVVAEVKIAPLLLLTFIENAFKHGVSQELKKAEIKISLKIDNEDIIFSIYNSKPTNTHKNNLKKEDPLGLRNVKQQLELLYSNKYELIIRNEKDCHQVTLRLQ